jgi:hypothetical protein
VVPNLQVNDGGVSLPVLEAEPGEDIVVIHPI